MSDNNKLPIGWGESEDDDDYDYSDFDNDDDVVDSPFKKKYDKTELSDSGKNNIPNTDSIEEISDKKELNVQTTPTNSYANIALAKKSKTVPILITIIILIVAAGVAGGIYYYKTHNANKLKVKGNIEIDENDLSISESVVETSNIDEYNQTTDSNIDETNAEPKAEITDTSNDSYITEITAEEQSKVKEAYIKTLTEFTKSSAYSEYGYDLKYALYDIDGDAVEELIIQYQTDTVGNVEILYYYKNGEYYEIASCAETSFDICSEQHCVQWYGFGGCLVRYILTVGEQGNSTEELIFDPTYNSYSQNNKGISKEEYDSLMYKYDSMRWISPTFYNFKSEDDVQNPTVKDPYSDIKQEILESVDNEWYSGKNSYIENAPSDMVFYQSRNRTKLQIQNPDVYSGPGIGFSKLSVGESNFYLVGENNDWYYVQWIEGLGAFTHPCYGYINKSSSSNSSSTSEFIATGKIVTEKDPLNLRAAPSADAEIVYKIPKGDYVGIYYIQDEWLYVKYYTDDNSPAYYGYVNSAFVDITWTGTTTDRSSSITPVTKYGTIYSPSGSKIDGFAASYVIDGGAVSYIRHDLTRLARYRC